MARWIPFQGAGLCIDCGEPHRRAVESWRCWSCSHASTAVRGVAGRALKAAIAAGTIPAPTALYCVDCEAPAVAYDHRDYSKPLAVSPVCHRCNQRRGPGFWQQASLVATESRAAA